MERIVRGRSATLTKTFSFTPTGTPTVALTRVSDGTAVATGGVSGAGVDWSYTIPASSNTLLDTYTETWTAVSGGANQQFVDYIQVAGDVLFTVDEARAFPPLNNTTLYPTAKLVEMRILVEQAFEAALGYALVPRYKRETFTPEGGIALWSRVPLAGNVPGTGIPFVTTIRSVTIAGVTVTPSLVAPDAVGWYYDAGWGNVRRSVTIGFEHGAQYPPERVKRAALFEARTRLIQANSPTDDRTITQAFDGGTTILQQPGRGGKSFYLPESDAVIDEFGLTVGVA